MSYIEDILYEALKFGIYKETINRVKRLQEKDPHAHLDKLYDDALQIEKKYKKSLNS